MSNARKFLAAGASALVIGVVVMTAGGSTEAQTPAAAAKAKGPSTIVATRRLTESQYRHAIADIFGSDIQVAARFEPDKRDHGLMAIGSVELSITPGGFEQYLAMARSIADQALDDRRRAKFATCKPADDKLPDDRCVTEFVTTYGRKIFRRPLTPAEISSRVQLANAGAVQSKNYYTGLKLALTSLLASPEFLFRVESAERDPRNRREQRLDSYTVAQRLSFLLWDSTPDEELLTAAATGELQTPAGLDKQITRLVGSPRMQEGVRAFFSDMLQFELFESLSKDAATYPKYSQAVANSAREQTLKTLVDLLITRNGDYRDIFTSPDTFIDRSLAAIYDLPYLSTAAWTPYRYPDSADQAGILTQMTFLSLFSHAQRSSPTKRGKALNETFLCEETPTPPADVDFTIINDTSNAALKTVRTRLLAHATEETCAGCHNLMDPIGLSLERFDGLGQPRMRENGEVIDVTAELDGVKFDGARGLGRVLRTNPRVPKCLVRNIFAYGVGRDPTSDWEKAFLAAQTKAFAEGGYKVPALMRAIASSPSFYRVAIAPPATPAPAPKTPAPKAKAPAAKVASNNVSDRAQIRLAGGSR